MSGAQLAATGSVVWIVGSVGLMLRASRRWAAERAGRR